jgi:hypothetical protein
MSHTPTPWRIDANAKNPERRDIMSAPDSIGGRNFVACNVSAEDAALIVGAVNGNAAGQSPNAEGAAAFIVKACNAHDELVAALEYNLAALGLGNFNPVVFERMARAALAKVEEGVK